MLRTLVGALVGLLVLATATVACAGIPDPGISAVALSAGGLVTCPQGDGPQYQYITVTAKRSDSTPIQGIPYTSFFFTVTGGAVTLIAADTETNVNGEIRFGVVGDETIIGDLDIEVQIYTVVLDDTEILTAISFDYNEDNQVSLQDFTVFSGHYGTSNPASDFNFDGTVSLQDFTLFSAHYGHSGS
jgi:hypothetical protein